MIIVCRYWSGVTLSVVCGIVDRFVVVDIVDIDVVDVTFMNDAGAIVVCRANTCVVVAGCVGDTDTGRRRVQAYACMAVAIAVGVGKGRSRPHPAGVAVRVGRRPGKVWIWNGDVSF